VERFQPAARRQRSLQYFTVAQSRSHFFRQVKGRPHRTQVLAGRSEGGRWRPPVDFGIALLLVNE